MIDFLVTGEHNFPCIHDFSVGDFTEWSDNALLHFSEYVIGLRQGDVMSPVMFSLFVEDIELHMQSKVDSGIQIDDIMLIMLLFADDMAIFAKTPEELQDHLNDLLYYCNSCGLHVNTNKTKVMVFRKRGGVKLNENWSYDNNILKVVDNFNYLGTIFNYTIQKSACFTIELK